jgi:hypothetical protein
MKIGANKSIEIRSHTKAKNTDTSITIASECGNLVIEAKNGDVVLKGKNVQIEATDKDGVVFIKSAKTIRTEAPRVDIEGTYVNVLADLDLSVVGANTNMHGAISMAVSEGHEAILNGSLLSKIINGLDEIKQFFKSPCGG